MIKNLSVYSEWKKATLKRLTDKYRIAFVKVFASHTRSLESLFLDALEDGDESITVHVEGLDKLLMPILVKHQAHTVKVAVADGIREIHPESKLSTWENFSIDTPIEDTFRKGAELAMRDTFAERIAKKIRRENKTEMKYTLQNQKKEYLSFIQKVFRDLADDYHKNEDTDDTKETVRGAIQRILGGTKARAEGVFRTETTRYFNDARLDYFQENTDVDFVQLIAVTDGRISNICESRDMYVIPLKKAGQKRFKPPFHVNCRTIQSPLDTDLEDDAAEVRKNLGSEFGSIRSGTSDKTFKGARPPPNVPLPRGWA